MATISGVGTIDFSTELGGRIREARRQAGLSQAALARELGISQADISTWERGVAEPAVQRFIQLVHRLGPSLLGKPNDDWLLLDSRPQADRAVPSGEELGRLVSLGLSDVDIAQRLGMSPVSIPRWRARYQIPSNSPPSSRPSRDELVRLVDEGLSDQEIGLRCDGAAAGTVAGWRQQDKILRVNPPERPRDEELLRLVEEGYSDQEIGKRYGRTARTAAAWRHRARLLRDLGPPATRSGQAQAGWGWRSTGEGEPMSSLDRIVGRRIRDARRATGMTQEELARRLPPGSGSHRLSIAESSVSGWERGFNVPSLPHFLAVLRLFGPEALGLPALGFPPSSELLGPWICRTRIAAGLRQHALAKRVGVQQSSVSQWERGKTAPSLAHFMTIVEVFGSARGDTSVSDSEPEPASA